MTREYSTAQPMGDVSDGRERWVEAVLGRLGLEGWVRLVSGASVWAVAPNPEVGLGRLVMSDGPVGVRGERWSPDDPSVQLPSPTALAATWDRDLVVGVGRLLAQEARRKGVQVLLAPTVNMHRSPLGGRHFECFSEDPLLTGEIGAAYVTGVQQGGVAATVKHFVANDCETERLTVDVVVEERTLREVYLAPFERIVRGSRPWAVMAAYNGLNGTTMTANAELNAVLRQEWGFDGIVVSDWMAARDTVADALAGLDVAMPGPDTVYGAHLVAAVRQGRVPQEAVEAMARRVLRLAARVGLLEGVAPVVPAGELPAEIDGRALARRAATRAFTLLRNQDAALPIDPAAVDRIAVAGLAAVEARTSGGGSATVFAERTVTPLEGLRAALPDQVTLTHTVGCDPRTTLPPLPGPLTATFLGAGETVLGTSPLANGSARWLGELPDGIDPAAVAAIEVAGEFTPTASGTHTLGVAGIGHCGLTVDGEVRFDGVNAVPEGTDPASALLHPPETTREVVLTAGEPVRVSARTESVRTSGDFALAGLTLGHTEPLAGDDALIERAVRDAVGADVAVVVVSTTEDVESEGFDRASLALPGRQDELVARVAAVNRRTVVVVNAGAPVLMPWRADAAAILLTWFGGQELGAALADVLLGEAEPGGRLPTTWPARQQDVPVLEVRPTEGRLTYAEGVFVGYRAWERAAVEPAFPFGHGLGYTDWHYQSVALHTADPTGHDALATVQVRLRNTGPRTGREVVQVYLAPLQPDPQRPRRWLVGFATVQAAPGQQAGAEITIDHRAAEIWDLDAHAWRLVPGDYQIQVGRSHTDTRLTAPLAVP